MRSLFVCLLLVVVHSILAQTPEKKPFTRGEFIFGAALGGSSLHLSGAALPDETQAGLSLPNFKIGKMITGRTALLVYLPGTVYTYKGEGRQRDRGFEGIIPSAQYWLKERWWVIGGAGLGMDAPAFYDIKNKEERKFYFGPTALAGTGFEIWRKDSCTIDLQARAHYSAISQPEGTLKGLAYSVLLGFNFY